MAGGGPYLIYYKRIKLIKTKKTLKINVMDYFNLDVQIFLTGG